MGAQLSELTEPNRYVCVSSSSTRGARTHRRRGRARWRGSTEKRREAMGGAQFGGGAPPLPPCTGGSSRETLEHRERLHAPELGLLRRAQTGEQLAKRLCLGGRGRWGESFQANKGPFYRREREHGASGSAERARPVSANGGEGRSGLSAGDCGVL
jgi:hypothetical protein